MTTGRTFPMPHDRSTLHTVRGDRVPVGYVSGVFDMFHIGHLNLIERARECCDVLVVGVLSDAESTVSKGRPPVIPEHERLAIVRALAAVDEAILDPSLDKRAAWRIRRFDVLYKGDDWRGTEKGRRMEQQLAEVGARIEYFPYTAHTSSTVLRQHLEGA
jgi:glycerol-3-phosphate cytidylyltransferase